MCVTPQITNWIVFTPSSLAEETKHFLKLIKQVVNQHNFNLSQPKMSVTT